ncbi:CheR family methyltransferase [Rhodovulum strictum]|uniref:Chemotaxis protein methyltransferase n=1 Tax=Rhodovulum strictum TaxID=58314 RepID=A0A844BI19_9RHOB|nr:protein-glutamate O-methyltransferase CheR [Rhodovulum strictum]MRH22128.1 chemotaxis protein [Rhodovulum strictum]
MRDRAASIEAENSLTEANFSQFHDFFYRKTGITFDSSKRYFVAKRLARRMQVTGHTRFNSYFSFMRLEPSQIEFQALVNEMTVNETYFFREKHQFQCLVDSILPEISARRPRQPITIWSMPCATGEEPYSVALYLMEYWPGLAQHDVSLLASDIDTNVLKAAREGYFNDRSLQYVPPELIRRHFKPSGPGRHRINPSNREVVDFAQVNLLSPPPRFRRRDIDVVFCRNLLIYFDQKAQRQAVENLADALRPGGFVLLGHSESMSRISDLFEVRRFPDGIVYQKPFEDQ